MYAHMHFTCQNWKINAANSSRCAERHDLQGSYPLPMSETALGSADLGDTKPLG